MGYYVRVESDVKVYVEDLNPEGKKQSYFYMGGLEVINCLSISLISYLKWDIDVLA